MVVVCQLGSSIGSSRDGSELICHREPTADPLKFHDRHGYGSEPHDADALVSALLSALSLTEGPAVAEDAT